MKTCCCTGHRPKGFPFAYGKDIKKHKEYLNALEEKIKLVITEYGVTSFVSGMALGVDLDFAEIVLKLRNDYPLSLECAIPCPNQTLKWADKDIIRYNKILERADCVTLVSDSYTSDCMLIRNRYMVDKSDIVIAVFNGIETGGTWYTINYAEKKDKQIEVIDLREVKGNCKNSGKKKIIKAIIITLTVIAVYVGITFTEAYFISKAKNKDMWEFIKDTWEWYKTCF